MKATQNQKETVNVYQIPSSTGEGFYTVTVDVCSCKAFEFRKNCKHQKAVIQFEDMLSQYAKLNN